MKNILLHISNDVRSKKNQIFDTNIDVNWSPYKKAKKLLQNKGIALNTLDLFPPDKADRLIFFDVPYPWDKKTWQIILKNTGKSYLFCYEPPIVNPFNYLKVSHNFFKRIYTWNDDLVDNKKYFKFHWPQSNFGLNTKLHPFIKKRFLVLINGNKLPFAPFAILSSFGKEIYSERIKAIEYFEEHIPDDFSLFGKGWNKQKKLNIKERILGFKKYSTYKGEVDNKIALIATYKYSICFENLTDVNGYFTEKLFDCFKARCVPIYWGASNVDKYIPKECFIDYREYMEYGKLLNGLQSINEKKYNSYVASINKLLADKKFLADWFEDGYVKFFLQEITPNEEN